MQAAERAVAVLMRACGSGVEVRKGEMSIVGKGLEGVVIVGREYGGVVGGVWTQGFDVESLRLHNEVDEGTITPSNIHSTCDRIASNQTGTMSDMQDIASTLESNQPHCIRRQAPINLLLNAIGLIGLRNLDAMSCMVDMVSIWLLAIRSQVLLEV